MLGAAFWMAKISKQAQNSYEAYRHCHHRLFGKITCPCWFFHSECWRNIQIWVFNDGFRLMMSIGTCVTVMEAAACQGSWYLWWNFCDYLMSVNITHVCREIKGLAAHSRCMDCSLVLAETLHVLPMVGSKLTGSSKAFVNMGKGAHAPRKKPITAF